MRRVLVLLLLFLLIGAKLDSKNTTIKIGIINSYDFRYPCGRLQLLGFLDALKTDYKYHNYLIEAYYMRAKTTNITQAQLLEQQNYALKFIKNINPTIIYCVDDPAFYYVGCKLKTNKQIIFSGINQPYSYYKCNSKNISGVEEFIDYSKLKKLLRQTNINTIIIFSSKSQSLTEKGYILETTTQLKDYKIIKVYNDSDKDIINNIKKYCNDKSNLAIIAAQRVYSFDKRKYLNLAEICRLFVEYNRTCLEVSGNPFFTKRPGIALTISPDFYRMGFEAGILAIKSQTNYTHKIIKPKNILTCNYKRLQELGFEELYLNNPQLFDKVR